MEKKPQPPQESPLNALREQLERQAGRPLSPGENVAAYWVGARGGQLEQLAGRKFAGKAPGSRVKVDLSVLLGDPAHAGYSATLYSGKEGAFALQAVADRTGRMIYDKDGKWTLGEMGRN